MTQLRAACPLEIVEKRIEDLPLLSEGLARRDIARSEKSLDLAPTEWRQALQSLKTRRTFITASATIFGVWLLLAAGLVGGVQFRKAQLSSVKAELERLSGPAKEVLQLQSQVRSLKRYGDRTYSGLECLREISTRLPPGLEITSMTYKKYGQVNIRGEADSGDPIYEFFKQLEESGLFRKVDPEGVTQQVRGGRPRSQFKVTCELPEEKS
jgi:Tfp pilus assembly protein PilN